MCTQPEAPSFLVKVTRRQVLDECHKTKSLQKLNFSFLDKQLMVKPEKKKKKKGKRALLLFLREEFNIFSPNDASLDFLTSGSSQIFMQRNLAILEAVQGVFAIKTVVDIYPFLISCPCFILETIVSF